MNVLYTTYTIELTRQDIEIITTALHGQYKTNRELYQGSTADKAPYIYAHMKDAQELRNTFGHLINRSYMGEDA